MGGIQEREVVEVGAPAVDPVGEVVRLEAVGAVTAGERANAPVAELERRAERGNEA